MSVTLAEAKLHVVVGSSDDDALIESYIDAAKGHVVAYLRRDLDTEFPTGWPEPIKQAVLFLVAHWYANREAVLVGAPAVDLPLGFKDLLAAWRDLS